MELIEYKEMREAIVRVRELHKPLKDEDDVYFPSSDERYCSVCFEDRDGWDNYVYIKYPCPTIKALDGML